MLRALGPLARLEGLPLETFLTVLVNEALASRLADEKLGSELRSGSPKSRIRQKRNKIKELAVFENPNEINDLELGRVEIRSNAKTRG